jgi:hypothetical protein
MQVATQEKKQKLEEKDTLNAFHSNFKRCNRI